MGRRLEALRNFATSALSRGSPHKTKKMLSVCSGHSVPVSGKLLKFCALAPQRFGKAANVERRGSCGFRHKIADCGRR